MNSLVRWWLLTGLGLVLTAESAWAYIGPGAGFAVGGSFLVMFAAVFSAVAMALSWPIRWLWRLAFRKRPPQRPRFQRVVILGLDGLDYGLTVRWLQEGKLPHLAKLQQQGCFRPLGSTLPPISPVAWSTFQTGTNPGKHNIFDFLVPDERTYQPKLSSVEVRPPRRAIRLGPLRVPLGPPEVRLLRKSQPFWAVLSHYGIFNCVLRVPISFPAEKLHGVQLSAMCVPDIRGSQGTFSLFTTRPHHGETTTGGEVQIVKRHGNVVRGELVGPDHPLRSDRGPLKVPFTVFLHDNNRAELHIDGATYELRVGHYTSWVPVCFRTFPRVRVHGVCRFLLLATQPDFELYATPVHIDPEKPALPIGYPAVYPVYLASKQGSYATLGLAEDTWGLNEQVLTDDHFRQQCLDTDREREEMFFDALEKVSHGLCVCVFDGSDRLQHMFWRYHDAQHPARPADVPPDHAAAIEDLYRRMDALVGRTMARCDGSDTLLMVLSDHGFTTFRRGVDLNRWLEENGYLVVDDARRNEDYLAGVDWSRTRAFALGLTGIFINLQNRFAQGIVAEGGEADQLRAELAEKLATLTDPSNGQRVFRRIYQAQKAYRGGYVRQAPDLILGYESGYRVSWDAAVGRTTTAVFHNNTKAWSGDHCVDPSVVPGILFCNQPIREENPRLLDIAPTILNVFGVPAPDYMDGRVLEVGTPAVVSPTS
ncbi:MAG: alkaline phosphatase family protein [Gemmataceae bacterium]|nr:alkaline phosphatase family protein [Gemmata sp.]MDW8198604.1 alkaline phosphatase family protein [Gemmataceae bacterium]